LGVGGCTRLHHSLVDVDSGLTSTAANQLAINQWFCSPCNARLVVSHKLNHPWQRPAPKKKRSASSQIRMAEEAAAPKGSVLSARLGDVQALKGCIAAKAAGAALAFAVADPKNAFGTPSVSLAVAEGATLNDPNAVALFLAGALCCAGGWIESAAAAGSGLSHVRARAAPLLSSMRRTQASCLPHAPLRPTRPTPTNRALRIQHGRGLGAQARRRVAPHRPVAGVGGLGPAPGDLPRRRAPGGCAGRVGGGGRR